MKRTVKLNNPAGLHLRPTSALVTLSKQFDAEVFIIKDGQKAKTTDILEVLCLGIPKGDVNLEATGEDAKKALDAIEKFCKEYEV
jgi:phosphotransferase system HPr (HPr) family protein